MKTIPGPKAKDKRRVYHNHRIEHEGNVWHIDAKADPNAGLLKVYTIHGDVSRMQILGEALQMFADSEALESYLLITT